MVVMNLLRTAQWQALLLAARRDSCQLGRDVEVRPSPNKGVGLFALRDLAEGAVLDRYTGLYMDVAEYDRRFEDGLTSGDYVMKLNSGVLVDAEDATRSSWVRYINHSKRKANTEPIDLVGSLDILFIQTTRDIAAGEEILFEYGDDYWDSRFFPLDPRRLAVDYL